MMLPRPAVSIDVSFARPDLRTLDVYGASGPLQVRIGFGIDMISIEPMVEIGGRIRGDADASVRIRATVADRDTGESKIIEFVTLVPRHLMWAAHDVPRDPLARDAEIIRLALRQFCEHEIDEAILVAGVRIYDPHK